MLIAVKRLWPANAVRIGTIQASFKERVCPPAFGSSVPARGDGQMQDCKLLNGNYLAIANLKVPQDNSLQINEESVS